MTLLATLALVYEVIEVGLENGAARQSERSEAK